MDFIIQFRISNSKHNICEALVTQKYFKVTLVLKLLSFSLPQLRPALTHSSEIGINQNSIKVEYPGEKYFVIMLTVNKEITTSWVISLAVSQ